MCNTFHFGLLQCTRTAQEPSKFFEEPGFRFRLLASSIQKSDTQNLKGMAMKKQGGRGFAIDLPAR